jgi:hypothetical protein
MFALEMHAVCSFETLLTSHQIKRHLLVQHSNLELTIIKI